MISYTEIGGDKEVHRQKIIVMPSETVCTNEIKVRALLNRLQDTASLAVVDLEGSPGELMRRGYGWVLLRYELGSSGRGAGKKKMVLRSKDGRYLT